MVRFVEKEISLEKPFISLFDLQLVDSHIEISAVGKRLRLEGEGGILEDGKTAVI